MSGIYVIGDTHASFGWLNDFIADKEPDIIFVCGDFGVWKNREIKFFHDDIVNGNTKIYFCDGNHENYTILDKYVEEHGWQNPIEIRNNIFYCPRGSSLVLNDGRRILFMGGALSVDKHLRKPYVSWFPQELITSDDVKRVDTSIAYDIVISHTCIRQFHNRLLAKCTNSWKSKIDQSEDYLSEIFDKVKPRLWYHGHWHLPDTYELDGCTFHAMNMTPFDPTYSDYGCWCELDD